jgi:hypothetical protein
MVDTLLKIKINYFGSLITMQQRILMFQFDSPIDLSVQNSVYQFLNVRLIYDLTQYCPTQPLRNRKIFSSFKYSIYILKKKTYHTIGILNQTFYCQQRVIWLNDNIRRFIFIINWKHRISLHQFFRVPFNKN